MKAAAIFLAAAVTVCGCGGPGKFTRVRYEVVHLGMEPEQVISTLGSPAQTTNDRWTYVNEIPYYRAVIRFEDGRVVGRSWSYERPTAQRPKDAPPQTPPK